MKRCGIYSANKKAYAWLTLGFSKTLTIKKLAVILENVKISKTKRLAQNLYSS